MIVFTIKIHSSTINAVKLLHFYIGFIHANAKKVHFLSRGNGILPPSTVYYSNIHIHVYAGRKYLCCC